MPGKRVLYHAEEGPNQEIELIQQMRSLEGRVMVNHQKRGNATQTRVHQVRKILHKLRLLLFKKQNFYYSE